MKKNQRFRKVLLTALAMFTCSFVFSQSADTTKKDAGQIVEKTKYLGVLNTTVTDGFLIKTTSFHYYVIDDKTSVKVSAENPEVVITKNGKKLFLTIQGTDKALKCHKEDDVTESNISGNFNGWTGNTSVKLDNGDEWTQDEPGTIIKNLFRPKVIVYRTNDGYRMKIEGMAELMLVKKK